MKRKPRTSRGSKEGTPEIPDAYDLAKARKECKEQGLQGRIAVAWLAPGVQVSLDTDINNEKHERHWSGTLYHQWLAQITAAAIAHGAQPDSERGLFPMVWTRKGLDTFDSEVTVKSNAARPRSVRCVACSDGSGNWKAWKEAEVSRLLCNAPGTPALAQHALLREEDFIKDAGLLEEDLFSTDLKPNAHRSALFGNAILWEVERLAFSARKSVNGFWEAFRTEKTSSHDSGGRLASVLNECKKLAGYLIMRCSGSSWKPWREEVAFSTALPSSDAMKPETENVATGTSVDLVGATALKIGFRIGRLLAQAEALIPHERVRKLAERPGTSGQHPGKFWSWVASEPDFAGLSARKVLRLLRGKQDPEYPGKTMGSTLEKLIRGDGTPVKYASFAAKLSKYRKRAKDSLNT